MTTPPLPPLPRTILERSDDIERYAKKVLVECGGERSFNIGKATRLLRTCVVEGLDIQAEHYLSVDGCCSHWLDEIVLQTSAVALDLARNAGLPEDLAGLVDGDIRQTLRVRIEHWKSKVAQPSLTELYVSDRVNQARAIIDESANEPTVATKKRGYRREVQRWMKLHQIENLEDAAKRLGLSKSALKSIMSDRGTARYGPETLDRVLKKIGWIDKPD